MMKTNKESLKSAIERRLSFLDEVPLLPRRAAGSNRSGGGTCDEEESIGRFCVCDGPDPVVRGGPGRVPALSFSHTSLSDNLLGEARRGRGSGERVPVVARMNEAAAQVLRNRLSFKHLSKNGPLRAQSPSRALSSMASPAALPVHEMRTSAHAS